MSPKLIKNTTSISKDNTIFKDNDVIILRQKYVRKITFYYKRFYAS